MIESTLWDYLTKDIDENDIFETENGVGIYVSWRQRIHEAKVYMQDLFEDQPRDLYWDKPLSDEYGRQYFELLKHEVEWMKRSRIILPSEVIEEGNLPWARRPFFMVRGRSITREQVKEMLKEELPMFYCRGFFDGKEKYPSLNTSLFGHLLPDHDGSNGCWLWDTGEIGGNLWSDIKYPEFWEFMPQWMWLAMKYPYLDMVVGYTNYNELPCYGCPLGEYYNNTILAKSIKDDDPDLYSELIECADLEKRIIDSSETDAFPCRRENIRECEMHFKNQKGEYCTGSYKRDFDKDYMWIVDVPQMNEDVVLTIQIKNGNITCCFADEARRVFAEYNKKYHFEDPYRYSTEAADYYKKSHIGEALLSECMREIGLDVETSMEYLVKKYGLKREYLKMTDLRITDKKYAKAFFSE